MNTENRNKAVKAGVEYANATANASARLWEFGKAVVELAENAPHGAARRLAVELAQKTGKKSSTWEVEISRAKKCFATYEKASDAAFFTLAETSGRETAKASNKGRRTEAVRKLEKAFIALSDSEVKALIEARKAAKKSK